MSNMKKKIPLPRNKKKLTNFFFVSNDTKKEKKSFQWETKKKSKMIQLIVD